MCVSERNEVFWDHPWFTLPPVALSLPFLFVAAAACKPLETSFPLRPPYLSAARCN